MQCPEEDMHIHILCVVIDMHHYINITLINTFQINHAVVYICMCNTKIVIHKYVYKYIQLYIISGLYCNILQSC